MTDDNTIQPTPREYSTDVQETNREYLVEKYTPDEHRAVRDLLYALAGGKQPQTPGCGICCAVDEVLGEFDGKRDGYGYCGSVFVLLDLDTQPLPYSVGGLWTGEHGKARRDLCRQMADVIDTRVL